MRSRSRGSTPQVYPLEDRIERIGASTAASAVPPRNGLGRPRRSGDGTSLPPGSGCRVYPPGVSLRRRRVAGERQKEQTTNEAAISQPEQHEEGRDPAATDGHIQEAGATFRHSYSRDRSTLVRRLRRIEGQVRGIERMIEREEYCVDILQQTAALKAAVESVSLLILEDHVQGCVRTAAEQGDADRYVEEVLDVVRRSLGRPLRAPRT